jgi:hypothetical protein
MRPVYRAVIFTDIVDSVGFKARRGGKLSDCSRFVWARFQVRRPDRYTPGIVH